MFSKRESGAGDPEGTGSEPAAGVPSQAVPVPRAKGSGAVIGASIEVDGTLKGNEDLLIQGTVKGRVELKNNSVTIGESGQVTADIYAQTIAVEGRLDGKLVASERVVIRKTAQIKGMIAAPRVMLEDGARFNGSIDMDPETEVLKSAFSSAPPSAAARSEKAPDAGGKEAADKQPGPAIKSLL